MEKKPIVIFDFDGTLYLKDASKQFTLFFYRNNLRFLWFVFFQLLTFIFFKAGIISTSKFKEFFFRFAGFVSEEKMKELLRKFWSEEYPYCFNKKLLERIKQLKGEYDLVCISASPAFLLEIPCAALDINKLIATDLRIEKRTVRLEGRNMRGQEKIDALTNFCGERPDIIEAYSDNLDDKKLLLMAEKGYVVKKGICYPVEGKSRE